MPTISPPALPPELIDAVIDLANFHDIPDTELNHVQRHAVQLTRRQLFATCSLVSKSWLPIGRYHLFKSVTLSQFKHARTMDFLDLLNCSLSTIAPFVQNLTLRSRQWTVGEEGVSWLDTVLPRLRSLFALESLYIVNGRFDKTGTVSFFKSIPKLRALHFNSCTFHTYNQLYGALPPCPSLESITLHSLRITSPKSRLTSKASPPPALKHLELDSVAYKRDLLKWFSSSKYALTVDRLSLPNIWMGESGAVAKFLRVLGPSLKSLTLGFHKPDTEEIFWDHFDLSHNPNLSFLYFHVRSISTASEVRGTDHIPPLLAQITSTHLREIVIDIGMNALDDLAVIDWDSILRILQRRNFSSLQRLVVSGLTNVMVEEAKAWIVKRLPPCSVRDTIVCQAFSS